MREGCSPPSLLVRSSTTPGEGGAAAGARAVIDGAAAATASLDAFATAAADGNKALFASPKVLKV